MERLALVFILGILLTGLVLAADAPAEDGSTETTPGTVANATQTVSEILDELREKAEEEKLAELEAYRNESNFFETPLPEILEKPTRLVFKISSEEEISLEKFVILVAFAMIFFYFALNAMEFSMMSDAIKIPITALLTLIAAVLGVMHKLLVILYDQATRMTFLAGLDKKTLIIAIIAVLALLVIGNIFLRKLVASNKIQKAAEEGRKAGLGQRGLKHIEETISAKNP